MEFRNRFDGIDAYAASLIAHKARTLVHDHHLPPHYREDIEQDLVLDLLARLPKYNPARAGLHTFVSRVINHAVADMLEAREMKKRDFRLCRRSLQDPAWDQEGNPVELHEIISIDSYVQLTGPGSPTQEEDRDLTLEVIRALEALPAPERELCLRLLSETVTEISEATGVPRSTLNGRIGKIRDKFERMGLHVYISRRRFRRSSGK